MSLYLKLKPEIKEKWVDALRGGYFLQGTGMLAYDDHETSSKRFCCLGVLNAVCFLGVEEDSTLLPCITFREAFTPESISSLPDGDRLTGELVSLQKQLAGFNDSGQDFKRIASFIEANL